MRPDSELTVDGVPVCLRRLVRTVPSARAQAERGPALPLERLRRRRAGLVPRGRAAPPRLPRPAVLPRRRPRPRRPCRHPHRHRHQGHGVRRGADGPVTLSPGQEHTVRLTPRRRYDAAARAAGTAATSTST
ncbi:hypothetical protein [Nonomuraea dietziae]|uniref:hypothetical protein n=1 Tax=Nonomuraea dietziae TaxID=65515 RepID=UPI0031D4B945